MNSNDGAILALVSIDTNGGEVTQDGDIPHWVRVLDVPEEGKISVYNSFTNNAEDYSWDDFKLAWAKGSGNGQNYLYIEATRP